MGADLHLHSFFSDGTFSPEEVVNHAQKHGLTAISLTDHDTMEGCARAADACHTHEIEFIPGAELTAEFEEKEVHILGYLLDESNDQLSESLEKFREVRRSRIVEMVERIQECGVALSLDQVKEFAKCNSPGRPHVARALVSVGICSSFEDAFKRFLQIGKPAWVPKFRAEAAEIIALIHTAGGIASLAHPGIYNLDDRLTALADLGLDGIECYHSAHSFGDIKRYLEFTKSRNMLVTGGSDCHGLSRNKPLIGSIRIQDDLVTRMKNSRSEQAGSSTQTST